MLLVLVILIVALAFEFLNGFNDCANSIATSIATRALTPSRAVIMAAVLDLCGALSGTAVAKTVGAGLVDAQLIGVTTILCALAGGICWNLVTWYYGLPSSSSHALMGGLCGAAIASAGSFEAVIWYAPAAAAPQGWFAAIGAFFKSAGLIPKVVVPMIAAPIVGLGLSFLFTAVLYIVLKGLNRGTSLVNRGANKGFRSLQLVSSSWMAFEHGRNDAQKTMGIITLTLYLASTKSHILTKSPGFLNFLYTPQFEIPMWIKIVCALTMAAGVSIGGWRIIRTLGKSLVRLEPVNGFSAQTSASFVIDCATSLGIPLSTTHVVSGSVMGTGATRRLNAVKWTVAERMLWAWIMTIPICAAIGFSLAWVARRLIS